MQSSSCNCMGDWRARKYLGPSMDLGGRVSPFPPPSKLQGPSNLRGIGPCDWTATPSGSQWRVGRGDSLNNIGLTKDFSIGMALDK